ncbi:hypothetical protein [Kitasatospora sp. SUK 42]|uniref:hypothetical protein n=1 Tax=Kitasatospora sp. SUK 42 TaxID=1588882 RepID=UPI0018CA6688|nr:hypothetical protein [Kitasatospora sp. SUK 42]MBV2155841.1 hypothetical protein [Kitasatospora sp. SUK 42]
MTRAKSRQWSEFQRTGAAISAVAFATAVVVAGRSALAWALDDPAWLGSTPWVVGLALLVGVLGLLPLRYDLALGPTLMVYALFAVPAVVGTAATTGAVQDIRQWLRTDEQVTVTLSGCHHSGRRTAVVNDTPVAGDLYTCTYSWSAGGRSRSQVRETEQNHRSGYETRMWADRSSGELAEHDIVRTAFLVFLAGGVDLTALVFGGFTTYLAHDSRLFRWAEREDAGDLDAEDFDTDDFETA